MRRHRRPVRLLLLSLGIIPLLVPLPARAGNEPISFEDARLKIEFNATDGDAGLQLFIDGKPWRSLKLFSPDGQEILDIEGRSRLKDFGLTELFSESSEPPFAVFPFEEFKRLWPEGDYPFVGRTIHGKKLEGVATLTHDVPAAPRVIAPQHDSEVSRGRAVIKWKPVTEPDEIDIVSYQVTAEREDPLRVFSADLPATAHKVRLPRQFLEPGTEYSAEVLAIEASGNQTLTQITFTVQ